MHGHSLSAPTRRCLPSPVEPSHSLSHPTATSWTFSHYVAHACLQLVPVLVECLEVLLRLYQLARLSLAPFLTSTHSGRPPYRVQCACLVRIAALQGVAVLRAFEYSLLSQNEDYAQASVVLTASDSTFYSKEDDLLVGCQRRTDTHNVFVLTSPRAWPLYRLTHISTLGVVRHSYAPHFSLAIRPR